MTNLEQIAREEQAMENRITGRMKREDRVVARLERRERNADQMIGDICKDGKIVHYVFPVGGKYREGTRSALIAFLLRNNYA